MRSNMNLEEFFKPNKGKIGIFIILSIVFLVARYPDSCLFDCGADEYGIPLPYYSPSYVGGIAGTYHESVLIIPFLILNLMLSYLISCILVWAFHKVKK